MRKNVLIFSHSDATQFVDINNQYTRLFDENKYNVTVAYLVGESTEASKKRHLTKNILFFNFPKKAIRGLKIHAIKKLLQLHREKNFEIVICHRYKPTYIMLWVALFKKIPALIGVMHDLDTLKSFSRQLLLGLLARKKNTIFAGVSDAVRDDMRRDISRILPKNQIVTLYNMIDVPLTEPQFLSREAARKELNLPNNALIFGTLGRLVLNKDQKTLIQAFALIKSAIPTATLVLIGDGILETELKNQVSALNLTQEVIFTGYIQQGYRFLKAFDLFILPSIQEAFGRVLLEAMIAKIPIIAARTHGIPEVMGDTGVVIEPADPQKLADAILKAHEQLKTDRDEWIQKAYQHAERNFSIQRFSEIFWRLPLLQTLKD